MKQFIVWIILAIFLSACSSNPESSSVNAENWKKRTVPYKLSDTLETGATYLSVYSHIYSMTEHRTHDLTATISMRNTNRLDTVFVLKAEYYSTKGELIRTYFNQPIFIRPMETVEIVIDQVDKAGGSGASFVFDWKRKHDSNEPFFESVMISTSGQQGISFTSQGKKINQ